MGMRDLAPPDAGASYLGTYGFGPWAVWLMNQASELVALTPATLVRPASRPPRCPSCDWPMVRRPGAYKCYRHDEPVVLLDKLTADRAPQMDVLNRINEVLEMAYSKGVWNVYALDETLGPPLVPP